MNPSLGWGSLIIHDLTERVFEISPKKDVFSRLIIWFSQMYDAVSKLGDFLNGAVIILLFLMVAVSILPPFV